MTSTREGTIPESRGIHPPPFEMIAHETIRASEMSDQAFRLWCGLKLVYSLQIHPRRIDEILGRPWGWVEQGLQELQRLGMVENSTAQLSLIAEAPQP